jgi:hypothetical protein
MRGQPEQKSYELSQRSFERFIFEYAYTRKRFNHGLTFFIQAMLYSDLENHSKLPSRKATQPKPNWDARYEIFNGNCCIFLQKQKS